MEHYYFVIAALTLGFFSAPHCIGMCGGIAGALALSRPAAKSAPARWLQLMAHNGGRLLAYATLGGVAGAIGLSLQELTPVLVILFRVAAGLLMVAMGLYIAGWWSGLRAVEQVGFRVWQSLLNAVPRLSQARAGSLAGGLLWGFLPCGLVYTMLVAAMATGSAIEGAMLMVAFGVGTLPTLFAAGIVASEMAALRDMRRVRAAMGATVILFGVWTAGSAIWMAGPSLLTTGTGM